MTKSAFLEKVKQRLEMIYSSEDGYSLASKTFLKNNGVVNHGIIIFKKGDKIAPQVYIDGFYQSYLDKKITIDEVVDSLVASMADIDIQKKRFDGLSFDFEACKSSIAYKLLSYERNIEYLEDKPFIKFLDLAIVFYVVINVSDEGMETVTLTNQILENWKVDKDMIYDLARENTPVIMPGEVTKLQDLLSALLNGANDINQIYEESEPPMVVITNSYHVNGAITIFYPNILKEISNQFDSDLYIIPSSIHEIIVVPATESVEKDYLEALICEVNENNVPKNEVLSDKPYCYLRNEEKIVM